MKKYVVIKVWSSLSSKDVVAEFDSKNDAIQYAALSKISDDKHPYLVAEVLFSTEE